MSAIGWAAALPSNTVESKALEGGRQLYLFWDHSSPLVPNLLEKLRTWAVLIDMYYVLLLNFMI